MIISETESSNFFQNIYFIADDTGVGITKIEFRAGMHSGYCALGLKRNSSPTIRIAKKFSDVTGYTIDELIMEPKKFRSLTRNRNGS